MTSDPAGASVRPRDAIFDFVLPTVLQHVLHNLLYTFAIAGVHYLEKSVKRHWLRIREAEQLSPFLRYPTFVTQDVPNHQTEVRRVNREAHARFAFPQCLLSPPAFRRSEEHTSELQSRSDLVCRLLL